MFKSAFTGAALALALSCAAHAQTSVDAFGSLPTISSVSISDDGKALAYIRNADGRHYIVAQSVSGEPIATADIGVMKIRSVAWGDADHVLVTVTTTSAIDSDHFVAIKGEWQVIYSLNIRTKQTVRLMDRTASESLNAVFGDVRPGTYKGKSVGYLLGYTVTAGGRNDVYRVNLDTGVGSVHQMGETELEDFVTTPDGEMAARTFKGRTGRWRMEVIAPGKSWIVADTLPYGSLDTPNLTGFGRTLDTVLTARRKDDRWELVEVDRATGKHTDLPLKAEASELIHAQDGHLVGVEYFEDAYPTYEFFEPKLTAAWAMVSKAFDGKVIHLSSWSADFSKLVINVDSVGDAGTWYVVEPAAKSAKRIGVTYPAIPPQSVAEVRMVRYKAADGQALTGFLTLPVGKDPKKLPLVAFPHGGPQSQDKLGFNWWAQAMASRGYAVFQPEFRGSSGQGEAFIKAGHGEIGRKMQTDISDGVKALAHAGVIDPKRVCIVGASYGGYAALAGVTIEQGLYRCAVAVAPVSDWGELMTSEAILSGSDGTTVSYWKRFTGATSTSDSSLDAISPLKLAAKADAPVLLIHGHDDTTVPFVQSDMMFKALQAAGKPVDLIQLSAEDHWLSREATRIQMLRATIAFLEKNNPPN